MKLSQNLKLAINASLLAGKKIIEVYNSDDFNLDYKEDNSPLTLADMSSNKIIGNILSTSNIPILSEEGNIIDYQKRKDLKNIWIVDPLDGTKEFIKRNGEFTVNIALIHEGKPVLGVIYVPVKENLYFALDGIGSYKKSSFVDTIDDLENLISVSCSLPIKSERDSYVVVGSRSHMSKETEAFFDQKKIDYGNVEVMAVGSSLKLCMVAEGKADAYPRYAPTMEWDTGAGDAICRMAGFQVLQYNSDKSVEYNKEDLLNPWFLVK